MLGHRSFVKQLGAEQREVFHKCLNGCHITQDGKKYCQGLSEDTCPYCECSDSRYHRFWECERFQAERAQVSPDVLAMVPTLPDFPDWLWMEPPALYIASMVWHVVCD